MVLQVLTDGRPVRYHGNAEALQSAARTHARGLQQGRRLESAGGDDDLTGSMGREQPPALAVFHASGSPLSVEENASGERIRGDVNVFANATLATQVAACRGPAAPVADVGLEIANAQLLCAVEVVGTRQANGFTGRDDGVAQWVAQDEIGDM